MNKRIKELARESGLLVHNPEGVPTKLEKFSELLIEECISIVQNLSPGYKDYRDQIEDAFRRDCIEEMRKHFGDSKGSVYTTPPHRTWVGLTDEDEIDWEEGGNLKDLVKAIEAKLKEKNGCT
jgi:hypothetical protein